jgi:Cu/Zn superoxide dismutase
MMAGETPTAMMAGETPTAMMADETPTTMMAETPGAMMAETPGTMMESKMDVALSAQNDSNQNGTATITDMGGKAIMVSITLGNGTTEPQPAHIHKGTCANLDPNPAYPLSSVVNGKSETEVAVSMDELAKGEYAINIHKSATEASVYVACGDIKVMGMMAGETPTVMMAETPGAMMEGMMEGMMDVILSAQNNSNQIGSATLTKKGDNTVMVSITLSNGSTEPQPAHIHKGTCANLDPNPAYPLSSVVNGKSETEVAVSMDELAKGDYAINIHKSATEASVYVACGDLKIK